MTRSIALHLIPRRALDLLGPAAAPAQSDAPAAPQVTQICLAPVAVEAAPPASTR